jgi:hypothetical protein
MTRAYVTLAVMSFNIGLLFIGVNAVVYLVPWLKNGGYTSPVAATYGAALETIYPGMQRDDIDTLLAETWSVQLTYEPFTMYRERPRTGRYVNVSEHGYRFSKDQAPWPPQPDRLNVFVFGGSTAFGYGVTDEETVASALGQVLHRSPTTFPAAVYNFGRGSYFSSQERILFQQLLLAGHVPSVAVFIDGLNDFFFYDRPDHSDQLEKSVSGSENLLPLFISKVPVVKAYLNRRVVSSLTSSEVPSDTSIVDRVIQRYFGNKSLIEDLAASRQVSTVFAIQPVPTYNYDLEYHLFASGGFGANAYPRLGYPQLAARRAAGTPPGNLVWCADVQLGLREPLYVDKVHYTPKLNRLLAECMAPRVVGELLDRSPVSR